jgi:hypothetical protein
LLIRLILGDHFSTRAAKVRRRASLMRRGGIF